MSFLQNHQPVDGIQMCQKVRVESTEPKEPYYSNLLVFWRIIDCGSTKSSGQLIPLFRVGVKQ